jgi:hypothetical protein
MKGQRPMVKVKSQWRKAWTGPRTARGKRRSALNRLKRGLCPGWVEQQLHARGENPEDFRQLHRDLMGHLRPDDARSRVIVETLAETWWVLLKTGQLNEMHAASLLFSTGYAKIGQTNVWH